MRMITRGLVAVIATLIAIALYVSNCSGPQTTATDLRVLPPHITGGPYRVEAYVHNGGPGHGEVDVIFRLVSKKTGDTVEADDKVSLDAGETSLAWADIEAPPGQYTPQVSIDYPPG